MAQGVYALPDDAVLTRMAAQSQIWMDAGDLRAAFLTCYGRMTANMLAAVARDEFHDAAWVKTLLHRFADYYFDALAAYEQAPLTAPPVWRVAHDAAAAGSGLAIQHMLLGINAHINYDLVLTVVDLLEPEWSQLAAEQRQMRYDDHSHVNDVIARTIDAVQDEVVERYNPVLDLADRVLGRLDEWTLARWLARWREEVWQHAVGILDAPDIRDRAERVKAVETTTLARADVLMLDDVADIVRRLI